MAAKDEDGNVNADDTFADGNVNADGNPAESGEIDQLLQDISNVLLSRQGFFFYIRLLLFQLCIYLVQQLLQQDRSVSLCSICPSNVFASELYLCLSIKLIMLRYLCVQLLLFMKLRAT